MSQCPWRCSVCTTEVRKEHWAEVQEYAAIWACHAIHLSYADLDLLDPLLLGFLCREALYKDNWSSGRAPEEELGGKFGGIHDLELPDKAVEVRDWIYATTLCSLPLTTEIQASQTTSQWLVQAFAANSASWAFQDVVPPYLCAFEDMFSKALFDSLPKCKHCKVYLLALKEQDKLDTFLQENLDSGCICPSKSPITSLVFFIKKKDGLLQLVQNYCILNAITIKNCYSLPLILELINNLWAVQYFTKLDVWWGYNNVHYQEGDKWKVTFWTNWGLFKPLVMFFGLANSLATFQTMMNDIF
ncbi:hypothetical protein E4T56_gene13856 [Termitomyces sp. T112]|nr:hypothetical protein E4T56_gene13856 [Termitomyces sp. T112]